MFMELLQSLGNSLQTMLLSIGALGVALSCGMIFIQSIIPCMPLGVFITGIFYSYGNSVGLLMCWISTCLGCITSYYWCNRYLRSFIETRFIKKLRKKTQNKIYSVISYIDNLSISSLTLLIACPFTPAFVINIAAGLAGIDKKKFYTALFIGKPFMIYFYGNIGTSLIESMNNPYTVLKVCIMLLAAYGFSKLCDRLVKA